MAVKTFTTGEVLTASDTNTYLNNGGLVYITGATISAAATYTFSNVFSSTYDNYRVVINSGTTSVAGVNYNIRLGTTATGYYGSRYYDLYTGGATGTIRYNNANEFTIANAINANDEAAGGFDMMNPNTAKRTSWYGQWYGNGYSGWFGGTLANTTQYTDLQFLASSGTMSAIIRIYGYRQA